MWTPIWMEIMLTCMRRALRASITLGVVLFFVQPASAQSYLEKLEKLIKEARTDETPVNEEEELPPPASKTDSSKSGEANNARSTSPIVPSRSAPSLVPPAGIVVPPPTERDRASTSERVGEPRPIYLGLEAEDPVGGGLGVRVTNVTKQSPAWKAGFEVGDRIVVIGKYGIDTLDALAERLAPLRPGEVCEFRVMRGNRMMTLKAVLMDAELAGRILTNDAPIAVDGTAWLGVHVVDLTSDFAKTFAVPVFNGAAVTNVSKGSPAYKAGIKAGDCIIEVAGRPIVGAKDLHAWIGDARPGEKATLRVYHGRAVKNVELILQQDPDEAAAIRADSALSYAPELSMSRPDHGPEIAPRPTSIIEPTTDSGGHDQAKDRRIAQLEGEVAELRTQLLDATEKLNETQDILKQIVERMKDQ